jgi:hypothetical protein
LLYTCGLVLWDNGTPGFGGYYARIAGFHSQGEGQAVEQALERLADELREHVESWDADIDEYAHARRQLDRINQLEEPPLVSWARSAVRSGELLEELRSKARAPILAEDLSAGA